VIWLDLKVAGAAVLAGLNLTLLVWAFGTHLKRRPLSDGYYKLLPFSPLVAAVLVALGLSFLARGWQVVGMHIFYATMISLGAVGQFLVRRNTKAGHVYRARPAVHGFLALFVMLLTVRAWMVG
jgi:hypothetical protein